MFYVKSVPCNYYSKIGQQNLSFDL